MRRWRGSSGPFKENRRLRPLPGLKPIAQSFANSGYLATPAAASAVAAAGAVAAARACAIAAGVAGEDEGGDDVDVMVVWVSLHFAVVADIHFNLLVPVGALGAFVAAELIGGPNAAAARTFPIEAKKTQRGG